jgi:hypothetical protein
MWKTGSGVGLRGLKVICGMLQGRAKVRQRWDEVSVEPQPGDPAALLNHSSFFEQKFRNH